MILSTQIPHKPKNYLEEIICDADLDYLGGNDFYAIGDRLRKELKLYDKIGSDLLSWNTYQLQFLESQTFFTATSKEKNDSMKEKYVNQIKEKINK